MEAGREGYGKTERVGAERCGAGRGSIHYLLAFYTTHRERIRYVSATQICIYGAGREFDFDFDFGSPCLSSRSIITVFIIFTGGSRGGHRGHGPPPPKA